MKTKVPYAAEILLEKIAYDFYIGGTKQKDNNNIADIVKFHYYATNYFSFENEKLRNMSPEIQIKMMN